ncbi:hypothetical protein ACGFWI_19440 [Streptomyces sp. NPDC048434]|uniref:hypothetical protein n=1 Tax=Streptomyces sp. NPDC048434 TaxID=3365549 RepID=UPI003718FF9C
MARNTGSQLRTARQLLKRIPTRKTTTSRSPSVVIRPCTGFPLIAAPFDIG